MDLAKSIAKLLLPWRNPNSFEPEPFAPEGNEAFGEWGELHAANYLREQGCVLLRRNFVTKGGGEVDLVCRDREELIFVEVKSRRNAYFGDPHEAVNREKQKLIQRGALAWLRLLGNPDIIFRFDIMEVTAEIGDPPALRWIKDAFELTVPY